MRNKNGNMEYLLYSWNVNGIRSTKNEVIDLLHKRSPTILSLQETRVHESQLDTEMKSPKNYISSWVSHSKKGYSGVANYYQPEIRSTLISNSINHPDYDCEGRILRMDLEHFILFNVYFPSGGSGNDRFDYKLGFYKQFLSECNRLLSKGLEIVVCGDVNAAHQPLDLHHPIESGKQLGFTDVEREWLTKFLDLGFIDTFRYLHPTRSGGYTWWATRNSARALNKGWRLDYFFLSNGLLKHLKEAEIHPEIFGSDHCPISVRLEFSKIK